MFCIKPIMLFFILLQVFSFVLSKDVPFNLSSQENSTSHYEILEPVEKVQFQFLYETGCPYSVSKYKELIEAVEVLGPYLEVTTYPFGIAYMTLTNSHLSIECQHGERECYGNRLHACAIDVLQDPAKYIPFNGCMMLHKRKSISNDYAANACGIQLNVNPKEIKSCAKNFRGFQLLLHYGLKSNEMEYSAVPWWFTNGEPKRRRKNMTIKEVLCEAFKNPPEACEANDSGEESS